MRNEWSLVAVVLALGLATPARAGSTADDLTQMEAEHVLLKARLKLLETQSQIAARQADIARHSAVAEAPMPSFAGIEGINGRLHATLIFDNDYAVEVTKGDTLPNGMKVIAVRPNGVTIEGADKRRVSLKPAGTVARSAQPAAISPPLERTWSLPPADRGAAVPLLPPPPPPAPLREGAGK